MVTIKADFIERIGEAETSLLSDSYLFRDHVRDALFYRYDKLSTLSIAHICVSLDYFCTMTDVCNDHEKDDLVEDS
ncbi:MAG: hypothetical protein ACK46A_06625 [Akkermansiaceae bacterium]|nr:hypothetical protein [Luteolibacter sp.]